MAANNLVCKEQKQCKFLFDILSETSPLVCEEYGRYLRLGVFVSVDGHHKEKASNGYNVLLMYLLLKKLNLNPMKRVTILLLRHFFSTLKHRPA